MSNQLDLKPARLLRLQVSQSNPHRILFLGRVVALSEHSRVTCSNSIIVSLLSLFFVTHLGMDCLTVERCRELCQQNFFFEWKLVGGLEGNIFARVDVSQIEIAGGEPSLNYGFDINLLQGHQVPSFATTISDKHTSLITASHIAD